MPNGDWLHDELQALRNDLTEGFEGVHKTLAKHITRTEGRLAKLEFALKIGAGIIACVTVAAVGALAHALGVA